MAQNQMSFEDLTASNHFVSKLGDEQVDQDMEADEEGEQSSEPRVFSVSELNELIKGHLESEFPQVWVQGEISNFKAHSSGHFYFSLKDQKSQINAMMFRGRNRNLKFRPEAGMEVILRGSLSLYLPRGTYSLNVESMEPVGAGALQIAFEQLKEKLQKEGLFDSALKRPIPQLPSHIAIVTSPTGAALRDMQNVLQRRFKGLRITVVPCLVQGDQAPSSIVKALQLVNQLQGIDAIIIGRGGGSMEDLWCFNDEQVARSIRAAKVPIISAVGHEVDFTIADFVADLRAPTPSAAAELVVKNATEIVDKLKYSSRFLNSHFNRFLREKSQYLGQLRKRLIDPKHYLEERTIRCDELTEKLQQAMGLYIQDKLQFIEVLNHRLGTPKSYIDNKRLVAKGFEERLNRAGRVYLQNRQQKLNSLISVLDSLSPLRVVDRGYSLVSSSGKIIKAAEDLKPGDQIQIRFAQGEAEATVDSIKKDKLSKK